MRAAAISLLIYLGAGSAFAADPKIDNLTATADKGKVSAHFSLLNAFDRSEIVQGLQSGVPTSFAYIIEVYRHRPNWFDEGIDRSRIEVIATFNSVTREYLMNYRRDRKLVRSETFTDLEALEKRMTTIDEPALFDVGDRRPYKLRVRAKADLMRGWALYFIPWNFSTRWRDVRVAEAKP
ncbi:MAG: DUF4390 domain-containing protein [Acidobacteriota bacterium]|nr:DUF4390 domain-containing protein [Acidobacteriota bacterium]